MLNAVICDDIPAHALEIQSLLSQLGTYECTVCESLPQLNQVIAAQGGPDILFLDIRLKNADGVSEIPKLLNERTRTQIIFVTGYPLENCERVYDVAHAYFLTKPVTLERLEKAVRAAEKHLNELSQTITIKCGATLHSLFTADILYMESNRRKVLIHTVERVYEVYEQLQPLTQLAGPKFIQCHKSYSVNLQYARTIDGRFFYLSTGEQIPISQRAYTKVKRAFVQYLGVEHAQKLN